MANFTTPIKAAFGRYLHAFHSQLVGDTRTLAEFAVRDFAKAAVWAPDRMADQVEEMLKAWRKNDTSQADRGTPYLPVMIVALAKDYVPWQPDVGRTAPDELDVMIPADAKGRAFRMRVAGAEIRAQVVFCASDSDTARSMALQFNLWTQAVPNRRFFAQYPLAGISEDWPVMLEMPDVQAINTQTEATNITILAADLTLRATIPMLRYPAHSASDADGKGAGTQADPDGYLTVHEVQGYPHAGIAGSTALRPWVVTG